MTTEKSENGALELLMKRRQSFRKIYEEAPEGAKAYYRGACLTTVKAMGDGPVSSQEEDSDWEKLLHSLTDEDWEYLKSHAPTAIVACGLHATQSRIRKEKAKGQGLLRQIAIACPHRRRSDEKPRSGLSGGGRDDPSSCLPERIVGFVGPFSPRFIG